MGPALNDLNARYGRQMNFIFLDIDDDETRPFQRELGWRIPQSGIQPNLFLLDEEGEVLKQWYQAVEKEELEQYILAALE
jgi:hypothetical protein